MGRKRAVNPGELSFPGKFDDYYNVTLTPLKT